MQSLSRDSVSKLLMLYIVFVLQRSCHGLNVQQHQSHTLALCMLCVNVVLQSILSSVEMSRRDSLILSALLPAVCTRLDLRGVSMCVHQLSSQKRMGIESGILCLVPEIGRSLSLRLSVSVRVDMRLTWFLRETSICSRSQEPWFGDSLAYCRCRPLASDAERPDTSIEDSSQVTTNVALAEHR
ncbi:hypothetical protein Tco_1335890 [Tanacetum coccineum]